MPKTSLRCFLYLTTLISLLATGAAFAGEAQRAVDAKAALEMLKSLDGRWAGEGSAEESHAGEFSHQFRRSANDTVVMETMFAGSDHEMINMYHLDGEDLVLTHYCAAGNQPHMKLDRGNASATELRFDFAGGTNLDPAEDEHIHAAKIIFVDGDHITSSWTGYQGGTEAGVTEFELSRMAGE